MKQKKNKPSHLIERLAAKATIATGSTTAILLSFAAIILWAATGPIFHYSETWQLVINTGTTIITFLMVFLIQKSQNKESMAVQLKLNELVAASELASNRMVDVEDLTEEELAVLKKYYCKLKEKSESEKNLQVSHSVEEAENRNEQKNRIQQKSGKKMSAKK